MAETGNRQVGQTEVKRDAPAEVTFQAASMAYIAAYGATQMVFEDRHERAIRAVIDLIKRRPASGYTLAHLIWEAITKFCDVEQINKISGYVIENRKIAALEKEADRG
jgi:hypothetical protein